MSYVRKMVESTSNGGRRRHSHTTNASFSVRFVSLQSTNRTNDIIVLDEHWKRAAMTNAVARASLGSASFFSQRVRERERAGQREKEMEMEIKKNARTT